MVPQVGGEEGVDAGRADLGEQAVARAAADRDRTDGAVGVAGHPHAAGGARQVARGPRGELGEGQRRVECAQPAQAAAAGRVGRVGYERAGDAQVQSGGERVGDPGVGPVGVGVRHQQRDAAADQVVHHPALETGRADRCDGGGAAQVQRVVGDEQVRAEPYRLVDDLLDGVDGEQHAGDLGGRISADQADGVPRLGQLRRPEGVESGEDVGERGCGHVTKVTRRAGRPGCERAAQHNGSDDGADSRGATPLRVKHPDPR